MHIESLPHARTEFPLRPPSSPDVRCGRHRTNTVIGDARCSRGLRPSRMPHGCRSFFLASPLSQAHHRLYRAPYMRQVTHSFGMSPLCINFHPKPPQSGGTASPPRSAHGAMPSISLTHRIENCSGEMTRTPSALPPTPRMYRCYPFTHDPAPMASVAFCNYRAAPAQIPPPATPHVFAYARRLRRTSPGSPHSQQRIAGCHPQASPPSIRIAVALHPTVDETRCIH